MRIKVYITKKFAVSCAKVAQNGTITNALALNLAVKLKKEAIFSIVQIIHRIRIQYLSQRKKLASWMMIVELTWSLSGEIIRSHSWHP